MKKILYFIVAVLFAALSVYSAFAVQFVSQQTTLSLQNGTVYEIKDGGMLALPVNPYLVSGSGATWGADSTDLKIVSQVSDELKPRLGLSVGGTLPGRDWFAAERNKADSFLEVTAAMRGRSDSPYELYSGTVTVTAVSKSSPSLQAQPSAFTVIILPSDGALHSFSSGSASVKAAVGADGSAYIPIDSAWFRYYGQDQGKNTINDDKVQAYGLAAAVSGGSGGVRFDAAVMTRDSVPVIRLTPKAALREGETYSPQVTLSAANYTLAGQSKTIAVELWRADADAQEEAGPAKEGSAPVARNTVPARMTTGSSLEFVVPDDNFVFPAGNSEQQILNWLNANTNWIELSSGLAALVEKEFFLAGAPEGTYGVRLTANKLGTVPQGSTISIAGQAAYTFASAVEVEAAVSAVGNRITGISSTAWLGDRVLKNWKEFTESEGAMDIRPGDEVQLLLDSEYFDWENGNPNPVVSVTRAQLSSGKITVRASGNRSSRVLDSVSLANGTDGAYIKVKFVEYLVSVKELDFTITVNLAHNSRRHTDSQVVLGGTMENEIIDVYKDDDYVNLSDGLVAHARDSIRSIDVDLGQGVILRTRMTSDKKYYGYATQEVSQADEEILDRHPEIDAIYRLHTIGFHDSGRKVEFDTDRRYYVYSADGEYLGTTRDKLGFSAKYYLAREKIEMDLVSQLPGGNDAGRVPVDDIPAGPDYPGSSPGAGSSGTGGSGDSNHNPANGRGAPPAASLIVAAFCLSMSVPFMRKRG